MVYAPGTLETDQKKQNMALQQQAKSIATLQDNSVSGPASATDNALARFDATTGKLIQNSEVTLGDTDGKLTRAAGISLSGTNTNDDAAAGYVGEFTSASLDAASRFALSTGTPADVTSISLTAGDWDVTGFVNFEGTLTPSTSYTRVDINTTSATTNSSVGYYAYGGPINSSNANVTGNVPLARYSLSSTTTIYLVATAGILGGTIKVWGFIRARRVR